MYTHTYTLSSSASPDLIFKHFSAYNIENLGIGLDIHTYKHTRTPYLRNIPIMEVAMPTVYFK